MSRLLRKASDPNQLLPRLQEINEVIKDVDFKLQDGIKLIDSLNNEYFDFEGGYWETIVNDFKIKAHNAVVNLREYVEAAIQMDVPEYLESLQNEEEQGGV